MVMPERDVPGISASACHIPRTNACLNVHVSACRAIGILLSAHHKRIPNNSIVHPMIAMLLRMASDAPLSFRIAPKMIAGIVAMINAIAKCAFRVCNCPLNSPKNPKNAFFTSPLKYTTTAISVPRCTATSIICP